MWLSGAMEVAYPFFIPFTAVLLFYEGGLLPNKPMQQIKVTFFLFFCQSKVKIN